MIKTSTLTGNGTVGLITLNWPSKDAYNLVGQSFPRESILKEDSMRQFLIKEFTFIELAVVGTLGYLVGVAVVIVTIIISLGGIIR